MTDDVTRTVLFDQGTESLRMKRFLLTITSPDGSAAHRVFGSRRVTFGSSPDNDVVVDDPSVSRRHCELQVEAAGYRLVDLDSKNGTFLGDVRVRDAYLRSGTAIGIGGTVVRFETTDEDVEVLLSGRTRFAGLIGASDAMRELFASLERVADTDARVLLEGPPGVGKEHAANGLHRYSSRRGGEFVVFDCSAVAADHAEAELFGDESLGDQGGIGALEAAATGTLYLVDPSELSPELQARLARALKAGEYRRVGAQRAFPLTARVITGSERNLRADVERSDFRDDLYYQLAVVHIALPALRERPGDIPVLVEHFLQAARDDTGRASLNVTYATMERLKQHPWPGNVAELRNFIERAVALSSPDEAADDARFLKPEAPAVLVDEPARAVDALMRSTGADAAMAFKDAKSRLIEAFEQAYWRTLLERTAGNVSAAARIAGVHRKSVEYILKKHDISRREITP